jgi:uncharacterized RDD family membrane protein YckC
MTCSLCGEVCRCHPEPPPANLLSCAEDAEHSSAPETAASPQENGDLDAPCQNSEPAWRSELSARLDRYRARRKVRPPRYPSLQLPFDRPLTAVAAERHPEHAPAFEATSNAFALDPIVTTEVAEKPTVPIALPAEAQPKPLVTPEVSTGGKILEFPRFAWAPPALPPDQLAEPVMDRPRILEVPEILLPAPALGGITIEPLPTQELEKRPGIDVPLQSAPMSRRLLANLIDAAIVFSASALFGLIFWKIAAFRPPLFHVVGMSAAIPCLLWAAYQYLLIVYGGSTPGLRLAKLELAGFDGSPTTRVLRRWRVLASYLSAASLGMGYAWVFLDEDMLCWHDRITHTYLSPKNRLASPAL